MPVTPITPAQTDALAKLAEIPGAIEAMAEHLLEEDYEPGWVWPTHRDDDGYRGGGYVTIAPPDVQAHLRDKARRVLIRATQIAADPRLDLAPGPTADLAKLAEIPPVGSEDWAYERAKDIRLKWMQTAFMQGSDMALPFGHLSDIAEALRQAHASGLAAANPSGGWRPIETAPKDGTEVLLYRPLAGNSHDPVLTIRRTTSVSRHCWPQTVPPGCDGQNFTEGSCYATHWQPPPAPPGALGTEARSAETGTGSVEDEGPASSEATPSLPLPNPPKGQEETPCPMTVEEVSDAAIEAGCMAAWEVSRPFIAREFCGGNDPGTWSDQEEYLRAISRQEVRAAYQAIRASEEDR